MLPFQKGLKAMYEIRKILEKKQPLETWFQQIMKVSNNIENKRYQAVASPAMHHATRLQRKQRASPRSTVARRSVSCPERLSILSHREYIEKLNLQLSRTKSMVDIEISSWFGMNVDDLVQKVYMKYLSVNPVVDYWFDSDDESETDELDILKGLEETYLNGSEFDDCECSCHHHIGEPEEDVDPIRDKFIEETVSQVLDIRKLIENQSAKGKKNETEKIKESVKDFIQHVTEHFVQRRAEKEKEKIQTDRLEAAKTLQAVKERILPYRGRESNPAFFNEVYMDFLNHTDRCDCAFMKDGRGVDKATVREVALHVDHRMQAEQTVNALFLKMIRDSPDELKQCPVEMQIVYQFMSQKVNTEISEESVVPGKEEENEKPMVEVVKMPKGKVPKNFPKFGIDIDKKAFKQFPEAMQQEIVDMVKGGKVGRVAFRQ